MPYAVALGVELESASAQQALGHLSRAPQRCTAATHLFRAVRDGRGTATAHPLQQHGVETVVVQVPPQHDASMAVARAVGLAATERVIDGEVR